MADSQSSFLFLLTCTLIFNLSTEAGAQKTASRSEGVVTCELEVLTGQPYFYGRRGEYCEGLYTKQHSSSDAFEVLALHDGRWDLSGQESAFIRIESRRDSAGILRMRDISRARNYQLDFPFASGVEPVSVLWSLDIIRNDEVRLLPSQMLLSACIDSCDRVEPTLLLARVAGSNKVKDPEPRVIFRAPSRSDSILVVVRSLENYRELMRREVSSALGEIQSIRLPKPKSAGLFSIEFRDLKTGITSRANLVLQ